VALSAVVAAADGRAAATDTRPVLIGFADALAAPEAAWSLLESGVPVVAFTRRGSRAVLRHCREVPVIPVTAPEDDAEMTVREIGMMLASGGYQSLLPLDDSAVWLCDRIAAGSSEVPVAGPTGTRASLALDKREQLRQARAAGLPVPDTTIVESAEELATVRGLAGGLPVVLKSALAVTERCGRLVHSAGRVCGSEDELAAAVVELSGSEPLLVQPFIAGVGEGLFGLCGPAGPFALSAHRRLRMMNPQGSGSSACVSIPVDPELAAAAGRMLTAVGWRGLFMLEFLRDSDGTAWFMELNGRTWGSTALARRLGLEYPAWTLRQLRNPEVISVSAPREGQVCRHLGRELVHLLMVLRGPRSVALAEWPSRTQALREVLRLRRADHWYNWRAGDSMLFVADTVSTVLRAIRRGGRP